LVPYTKVSGTSKPQHSRRRSNDFHHRIPVRKQTKKR
jgi:hypothetical protein